MKLLGFVLSIVAVIVGLVGAWLDHAEDAAKLRRRRLIIAIAALGGVVALGILVVTYVDQQADERARESRRETIDEMQKLLKNSVDQLGKQSEVLAEIVKNVRTPVTSVGAELDAQTLDATEKGNVESWFASAGEPAKPRRYLELRQNSMYSVSMILAYLLGTPGTRTEVRKELDRGEFPTHAFLKEHGIPRPVLDYVVVVDRDGAPVGFWHSDVFAYQLLDRELIRRTGGAFEPERERSRITGFMPAITGATSAADLSVLMIQQHVDEALVLADGKVRHVDLAQILKPVAATQLASEAPIH